MPWNVDDRQVIRYAKLIEAEGLAVRAYEAGRAIDAHRRDPVAAIMGDGREPQAGRIVEAGRLFRERHTRNLGQRSDSQSAPPSTTSAPVCSGVPSSRSGRVASPPASSHRVRPLSPIDRPPGRNGATKSS